jgi:hypothetical protein
MIIVFLDMMPPVAEEHTAYIFIIFNPDVSVNAWQKTHHIPEDNNVLSRLTKF